MHTDCKLNLPSLDIPSNSNHQDIDQDVDQDVDQDIDQDIDQESVHVSLPSLVISVLEYKRSTVSSNSAEANRRVQALDFKV